MKFIKTGFIFFFLLIQNSLLADMRETKCNSFYNQLKLDTEKDYEILEKVDKYLVMPISVAFKFGKVIKTITTVKKAINVQKDAMAEASSVLTDLVAETDIAEGEAIAGGPEAEAAVTAALAAEEVALAAVRGYELAIEEISVPLEGASIGMYAVQKTVSIALEEAALEVGLKLTKETDLKTLSWLQHRKCKDLDEKIITKENSCISKIFKDRNNTLKTSTLPTSKKYSSTIKNNLEPITNSVKPLTKKINKFINFQKQMLEKLEDLAKVSKAVKAFKKETHKTVYITLKWPSVTHPTSLAHKKIHFSIHGLLHNAKKEIEKVTKYLTKDIRKVFKEFIKVTGVKAFEKKMVKKAKKKLGPKAKKLGKFLKNHIPVVKKVGNEIKDVKKEIKVILSAIKKAKENNPIVPKKPKANKSNINYIKQTCSIK